MASSEVDETKYKLQEGAQVMAGNSIVVTNMSLDKHAVRRNVPRMVHKSIDHTNNVDLPMIKTSFDIGNNTRSSTRKTPNAYSGNTSIR